MNYKYYINLTTGIEGMIDLPLEEGKYGFVRIQSTQCERFLFEDILNGLDTDFLIHLAMGDICIVVDYGARNHNSRAIRIGLEFIRYYLTRNWLDSDYKPLAKQIDMTEIFQDYSRKISKKTRTKMTYYRKYLNTNRINLIGLTKSTSKDSDNDFYFQTLFQKKS